MPNHTRVISILLLLISASAQQSSTPFLRFVPGGFLNAGQFSDLPPDEQIGYAAGFFNGMMSSGILGADFDEVEMLDHCTKGMEAKQIAAIIDKFVKAHPEGWHEPLAVHSFNALLSVCPDLLKRLETERIGRK